MSRVGERHERVGIGGDPMPRRRLLDWIADYARRCPDEAAVVARFRAFVEAHADCFERTCVPGHVTGSAWLVSHDRSRFLLTHHRKLGRWLQLGGHSDGDPDTARVALREASEESGIAGLALASIDGLVLAAIDGRVPAASDDRVLAPIDGPVPASRDERVQPLDLDAHEIPARGDEPAHIHYDVRFLVVAPPDATTTISDESLALRWFPSDQPLAVDHDESVARLLRKARMLA